jgi:UDP-N-acetylmuramoyl-L-alanyl-D-glutamate--2,6-diaminopimelate ligase
MKAEKLASLFPWVAVCGDLTREITGCASDSRTVMPGDLFLCFSGKRFDGHAYVGDALQRGAVAVAGERPLDLPAEIPFFQTEQVRQLAGPLSSTLYGYPSHRLHILGVTGTSGKTTSCYFLREALLFCGVEAELIGSLDPTPEFPFFTTPEAPALHKRLAQLELAGTSWVVLEVSSHAIHYQRIGGVRFAGALLTNLYRDHLELHGSEETYAQVKLSFLQSVRSMEGEVVVNHDFPKSPLFLGSLPGAISFSLERGEANLTARLVWESAEGSEVEVVLPGGNLRFTVSLPGRVNATNALGAFALLWRMGFPPETLAEGISHLTAVPGRYQLHQTSRGARVLVDYAHTPVALSQVLAWGRSQGKRVLLVFGCVGAGDRGKRGLMGRIAAEGADLVFLTTDDPRGENPAQIMADVEPGVLAGGKRAGKDYFAFLDRREAIAQAMAASRAGDLVILAGRGHEKIQRFGSCTISLDDSEEVARWS